MGRYRRLLREWMILTILLFPCAVGLTQPAPAADAADDKMTQTPWWDEKDSGLVALIGTAATLLIAAGTFWWGVITYRETKKTESQQPFNKEQFALCFEASNLASKLATETDAGEWDAARRNFWRLYYGPLCIVEDAEVARAMITVGSLIPKPDLPRPDQLPIATLEYRNASIQLAHKVRTLIQKTWNVDLGPLHQSASG
jgi:hypothetical protein